MTRYIALLRAVNVGGTGKLPMADVKSICEDLRFARVETYIASGNVVFESKAAAPRVKAELEARFTNPRPQTHRHFSMSHHRPTPWPLHVGGKTRTYASVKREIFIYYPSGMGRSKFRIQAAEMGTAPNMNTVAKLVEIVSK